MVWDILCSVVIYEELFNCILLISSLWPSFISIYKLLLGLTLRLVFFLKVNPCRYLWQQRQASCYSKNRPGLTAVPHSAHHYTIFNAQGSRDSNHSTFSHLTCLLGYFRPNYSRYILTTTDSYGSRCCVSIAVIEKPVRSSGWSWCNLLLCHC